MTTPAWLLRFGQKLGHEKWFSAIGRRIMPGIDRFVHRITRGRVSLTGLVAPTLVLVHTGRRSGRTYRAPLLYVRTETGWALAASNWGTERHPAWSDNLLASRQAVIELDGRAIPVSVRLLSPGEKEAIWPRFLAIWPAYDTYRERTSRDIRVFLCEEIGR